MKTDDGDSSTINPNLARPPSENSQPGFDDYIYEFGPFRFDPIDPTDLRLRQNKTPVHLAPMEFRLLCFLINNHDRKVTKEELVKHLWPTSCIELKDLENLHRKTRERFLDNLNHQIAALKERIGENIETKKGYQLRLTVKKHQRPKLGPVYEEMGFDEWSFHRQKGGRLTFGFGICVALSIVYLFLHRYFNINPVVVVSLMQAGVIACAIVASFAIFDLGRDEFGEPHLHQPARAKLKQYVRYWEFLLVSWLLLYLALALEAHARSQENQSARFYALSVIATVFNNCNSLALSLCYVVLSHPTESERNHERRSISLPTRFLVVGVISVLLFATLESALTFGKKPEVADFYVQIADLISGIIGGVCLALYVRVLQRRFLYTNPWLPLALYSYAFLQPFYFVVNDVVGEVWVIETALILKCLLFLYTAWLFKSGRLIILFSTEESTQ
jgi:DNA-binding winged helix-turn-helix (wHTH) protein